MVWRPAKDAVQRLWGRRWFRRISYGVVAGATAYTVGPWLASRPVVLRWALNRLDALVREETGLSLAVGRAELHPGLGSVVLHDIRLGGDFLTVRRVEVRTDLWSLLGTTRRIHSVQVDQPHLRLTEAGLAAIRFKSHPPRKGPLPQFRLDSIRLTGGEIELPEAVRGIPALHFQFDVKGTGLGPNHVEVDLSGTNLAVKTPGGWERGRLDVNGEASEPALVVHGAYLRLGGSQLRFNGRYRAGTQKAPDEVEARLTGVLDLAQAARWGGAGRPPLTGDMDLSGALRGSLARPVWTFSADGLGLRPAQRTLLPGSLLLKGTGGLDHARLSFLRWTSPQGKVEVEGNWARQAPVQATVQGTDLDLDVLGQALRLSEFRGVRGTVQAQFRGPDPGDPLGRPDRRQVSLKATLSQHGREAGGIEASLDRGQTTLRRLIGRPDRWQASFKAVLSQHGREAGGIEASLDRGRTTLRHLNLDLESLKLEGRGWAALDARGLSRLEGEGRVEVGASQVARALHAWKKEVDLDMDGQTKAQAKVRWSRAAGLELDGTSQVSAPRWHGARADSLLATVEIRGSDLRVRDIDLRKEGGQGSGELWLTWADTAPGQNQMDMCYAAFRLPVAEGLRAADLKDAEGKDLPLSGTGSGWVRLQGPFDSIRLNGFAQVESGEAYGIKIPAASSDFSLDLESRRLRLSDARIAERPELLGRGEVPPEGVLALTGQADMDFRRWTWWVDLGGRLDSRWLALPGPRFQSQIQARLLGPITAPFGGLDLPEGRLDLSRGRLFFGDQSLEGLEGAVHQERGRLAGRLGIEGMSHPLIEAQARQEGPDLTGELALTLSPASARTEALARSLTQDLLEDLSLSATAQGRWKNGRDLTWSGSLERLAAQFNAFELHQARPSPLRGDAQGAVVDVALEGGASDPADAAAAQAAQIRLSGAVPFSGSAPMAIQARGEADLAHLKSILDRIMEVDEYSLQSELRVQGTSRFDLLAHGTYAEPQLDGTLSLDKGQLHLRGYQGVEDLQAEVLLKNRTLAIPEEKPLRGTLARGELVASGAATWRLGGIEAYAMKASLADFQLLDVPDGLDLQGSLQATLEGTEEGGALQGKLWADRLSYHTEVKLADLILRSALSDSGGLVDLDPDDPLERIRLDLDLDLRAPWTFDTNLLKLEGRTEGPFQILGTLAHPVPKGTLVFQPGGRLTNIFPAGDMVVRQGSLSFSESRPLDPLINMQGGVSSIPGYTVNLDIRGTLSYPTIVLSSTPSLRQDEIVAILINPGNAANVGTAGASTGATQGAITSGLASAGSGLLISNLIFTPFQEQLRRSLGLDRVNVAVRTTSLGTPETEVTLGKSLSLLGQRSAWVVTHKKSGELSISSLQFEFRFGDFIIQVGGSKAGSSGINPSGEIRHSWSPK